MQSLPSDLKSSQCNWLIKKESFTDSLLWTMTVIKQARDKQGSLLCIAFNRLCLSDLNIAQIMHH